MAETTLNKTPVILRLSTGTQANIIKKLAYGWQGEPAYATDTRRLFIFSTTEGEPFPTHGLDMAVVDEDFDPVIDENYEMVWDY